MANVGRPTLRRSMYLLTYHPAMMYSKSTADSQQPEVIEGALGLSRRREVNGKVVAKKQDQAIYREDAFLSRRQSRAHRGDLDIVDGIFAGR